ncbi:MAG TPA: hypothetical protein DIW51_17875 [Rhodospirillaceae bacterium]|nr:hypothetical protein [Magnetovibrio sp.]HCS71832.1 hypothetical protein [Rhodospirillaceae bacterium]|tara:strand:- start:7143 stop:7664 length:522 start_codon:yes stop_codon:yes gene_type:complete
MKIDNIASILLPQRTDKPAADDAGSGSFAEMMAASVAPQSEDTGLPKTDLDIVREKGFTAYAKEVEERKREELREKILNRMGLSEEDLEKMPAEQRAAIEDLIAQEIQRRMQASAELENDKPGLLGDAPDLARDISDTSGTGSAGSVLLAAMEARDALNDDPATVADESKDDK